MVDIPKLLDALTNRDPRAIARAVSIVEDGGANAEEILSALDSRSIEEATVIGITGPPGAGKSSLTDRIIAHYRANGVRLGVVAIDPSSPITGGAILGDRIRMMDHATDPDVVMRSMATRGRLGGLCASAGAVIRIMAASGCSMILIETVGVGQSEIDIIRLADITALVVAPGLGDDIQAMKAGLLEVADILVINKSDNPGAETLALDMETVARERSPLGDGFSRVCKTSAVSNTGIEQLAALLDYIDTTHRKNGLHAERRRLSRTREILDWSLEMLRPGLEAIITDRNFPAAGDPRSQAADVIKELTTGKAKGESHD